MGRPSKYNKKTLKLAENYYKTCEKNDKIPFIQELARVLDVSDDTINEWSKAKIDFSATIEKIKNLQQLLLLQGGLEGKLNSKIAIFLLKANHGFMEEEKRLYGSVDDYGPATIIFRDPKPELKGQRPTYTK